MCLVSFLESRQRKLAVVCASSGSGSITDEGKSRGMVGREQILLAGLGCDWDYYDSAVFSRMEWWSISNYCYSGASSYYYLPWPL